MREEKEEKNEKKKKSIKKKMSPIPVHCRLSCVTCHMSCVTCHMSPLHSTCYKVSKNIRYVEHLIKICILLRERKICCPSSPIKLFDVQTNRVKQEDYNKVRNGANQTTTWIDKASQLFSYFSEP